MTITDYLDALHADPLNDTSPLLTWKDRVYKPNEVTAIGDWPYIRLSTQGANRFGDALDDTSALSSMLIDAYIYQETDGYGRPADKANALNLHWYLKQAPKVVNEYAPEVFYQFGVISDLKPDVRDTTNELFGFVRYRMVVYTP